MPYGYATHRSPPPFCFAKVYDSKKEILIDLNRLIDEYDQKTKPYSVTFFGYTLIEDVDPILKERHLDKRDALRSIRDQVSEGGLNRDNIITQLDKMLVTYKRVYQGLSAEALCTILGIEAFYLNPSHTIALKDMGPQSNVAKLGRAG